MKKVYDSPYFDLVEAEYKDNILTVSLSSTSGYGNIDQWDVFIGS